MSRTLFRYVYASVAITCASAAGASENVAPQSAPLLCEIQQKAWCIIGTGQVIENRGPIYLDKYRNVPRTLWRIFELRWMDAPAVVLEPGGCRVNFSDSFEVISIDKEFAFEKRRWNRIKIRLQRNGQCDLELLAPTLADDPTGSAFGMLRSHLKACPDADCGGASTDKIFGHALAKVTRE